MQLPELRYARSGDVAIAYQVVGSGGTDVVFMRHMSGDLLPTWDQPLLVRHVEGLARISSLAEPGEVLASSTVKDLVAGSGIRFKDRGAHELKGIPGAWNVFTVVD